MIAGRRVFRFPIAQRSANIDTHVRTYIRDAWMSRAQTHAHIHGCNDGGGNTEVASGERPVRSGDRGGGEGGGGGGCGGGCRGRRFHRLALPASPGGECERGPWTPRRRGIPVFMVMGKRAVSLSGGPRVASSASRDSRSEMTAVIISLISLFSLFLFSSEVSYSNRIKCFSALIGNTHSIRIWILKPNRNDVPFTVLML